MICYRDMTFCSAYPSTCTTRDCHRAFTSEDKQMADKWWEGMKGEAPIAFADLSEGCPDKQTREEVYADN